MITNVLLKIATFFVKLWCNLIIFSWHDLDTTERAKGLGKAMLVFGPVAFIIESLNLWYLENTAFTLFAAGFVLANAFAGGVVHAINKRFNWEVLLVR